MKRRRGDEGPGLAALGHAHHTPPAYGSNTSNGGDDSEGEDGADDYGPDAYGGMGHTMQGVGTGYGQVGMGVGDVGAYGGQPGVGAQGAHGIDQNEQKRL